MTHESLPVARENASMAELSAPDDAEVVRLASTIDFYSPLSIQEFGSEVAERTAQYTNEILQQAHTTDLDQTGDRLTEIVIAAQKFDLDSLQGTVSSIPVVGKLLKHFARSKEKAIARFESVKAQVDKLVAQVESAAELLNRRSRDYQAMYEGVREEHVLLGRHVQAIEVRLAELEAEISKLDSPDSGLEASERAAVLESSRQQLSKRADDLRVLQHSAMQMLPMVRIIQSNSLSLIDKLMTIRQLTLPAWKRTFMLALTLEEHKNAVELATTIDDATNMMMRRNAELLHQNSIETAKANQRMVIDVDTLREVHETILRTLWDVRNEHQQGAAERRRAIAELDRLRAEMSDGVKDLRLTDA